MNVNNSLSRRVGHITKCTQQHMDTALKPLELSSGSYPFILTLSDEEGINLEKLSRRIHVDKAMSTRTIQKLILLGYIKKLPDSKDQRACKLYLTDKAKEAVPVIRKALYDWIDQITVDIPEDKLEELYGMLDTILARAEEK
ncbi:MarR family winged helix-turn-helix transcriptional regulator [Anaerocolumna xylanovorans]|uniref:DNA-binding transcriptional regulator, MarR family n=1 Tax=Anaerocolumna xylanovorans DSM 12503 TaxID=1121345 RepID=A0A1M7Y9V7_9FIRM|nr:MarR family winged helix-turn-helix transcriptional regulator [Anaerocolumna xylanovorans]SHO49356.1 DNA-binding transcriptional regulator, MarR family [Anaerocolumna xylanovorans DSM 12503]